MSPSVPIMGVAPSHGVSNPGASPSVPPCLHPGGVPVPSDPRHPHSPPGGVPSIPIPEVDGTLGVGVLTRQRLQPGGVPGTWGGCGGVGGTDQGTPSTRGVTVLSPPPKHPGVPPPTPRGVPLLPLQHPGVSQCPPQHPRCPSAPPASRDTPSACPPEPRGVPVPPHKHSGMSQCPHQHPDVSHCPPPQHPGVLSVLLQHPQVPPPRAGTARGVQGGGGGAHVCNEAADVIPEEDESVLGRKGRGHDGVGGPWGAP